jgi:hypothetical protein
MAMQNENDSIESHELEDVTGGRTNAQRSQDAYADYVGSVAVEPTRTPTYQEYAAKFAGGFKPCETSVAYPQYERWLKSQPATMPRKR